MAVLDGVGICLILVKRGPSINPVLDDHGARRPSHLIAVDGALS